MMSSSPLRAISMTKIVCDGRLRPILLKSENIIRSRGSDEKEDDTVDALFLQHSQLCYIETNHSTTTMNIR